MTRGADELVRRRGEHRDRHRNDRLRLRRAAAPLRRGLRRLLRRQAVIHAKAADQRHQPFV